MRKDRPVRKVVLAYSGGLDTSVILRWLQERYGCEVLTFTADIGQGEELGPARRKALALGVAPRHIHVVDLREEFVRDFVFPMFRANALYEGEYLLGTSIARPLIAKHLVRIARETGADAIAHGATGKGNDQVRFELTAAALAPGLQIIAPWRDVQQRVRRPAGTATGDLHLQGLLPRTQRGAVRNGPVQPSEPQQTGDHPGGLSERQPEQHLDRQAELDRGPAKQRDRGCRHAARARSCPCPARSAVTRAS